MIFVGKWRRIGHVGELVIDGRFEINLHTPSNIVVNCF